MLDVIRYIDKDKYPERYALVIQRLKLLEKEQSHPEPDNANEKDHNKIKEYFIGTVLIGALIGFEFLLSIVFKNHVLAKQLCRAAFILLSTYIAAIKTEIASESKSGFLLSQLLNIGCMFSIVLGFFPRLLESGLDKAVDLVLLKENLIFSWNGYNMSLKANFFLLCGYLLISWGIWGKVLSHFDKK